MKNDQWKQFFTDFLKCGVAGWCMEVIFTSLASMASGDWRMMGKTSLLMFPIYGLGALLGPVGRRVDRWIRDGSVSGTEALNVTDRIVRHGMLYMVLIFSAEYVFGLLLKNYGICPWDYTGRHSNVSGLIRLDFAPLWFGAGLFFENLTKKRIG